MKIVTVTMNPSIDISTKIDHVTPDKKLRCENPTYELGGGGLNVSHAIKNLGRESLAIYPSGGKNGELFSNSKTETDKGSCIRSTGRQLRNNVAATLDR